MHVSLHRLLRSSFALAAVVLAAGCTEKLESGAACPSLCPEGSLEIVTTEISPVTLDTSIAGLSPLGSGSFLLIANRGDTAETRAVVRFDTLPARARRVNDTTSFAITKLDSAYLRLRIDTTATVATAPLTLNVYDVDTTGVSDTATVALRGLFRPGRLVGSITLAPGDLRDDTTEKYVDSLRVPIDTAYLRAKLAANARVRLGFALTSAASVQLRLFSYESQVGPSINYLATGPDTAKVAILRQLPRSLTPSATGTESAPYYDYTIVVRGTPELGLQDLIVGGLPGRRSYLRFDLPPAIVDSATVTRAEMIFTQRPNRGSASVADTFVVYPAIVLAGPAVTDPGRAALLAEGAGVFADSIVVTPADSGTRTLDVTSLLRRWSLIKAEDMPRAIVLRTPLEGNTPAEVRFFSSEAADPLLRPRLRISYVPRVGFGLP